ncbi:hypothetical protein DPMN_192465 [Dreissena polymorpha]|uniref:Uncharacterized protein n=1 Tax=Dreissena polymorpha TaxID=45954 RepID=A0A9D3Y2K1_DREPO|nr:hypothetical protein DPMN_192465 [Dreissena polymorpha]
MLVSRTVLFATCVLNVVIVFSTDVTFDNFYKERLLSYLRRKYPDNISDPANAGLTEMRESQLRYDFHKTLMPSAGVFSAMNKKAHLYKLKNRPISNRHTRITPFGQMLFPEVNSGGHHRMRYGK